jgi:excisionase family DNA binding protein
MMEIEPFVDANEASEFLGITRRHLLDMIRSGTLPGHPIGSGKRRRWRFRLSELAEAVLAKASGTPHYSRDMISLGGSQAVPRMKGL